MSHTMKYLAAAGDQEPWWGTLPKQREGGGPAGAGTRAACTPTQPPSPASQPLGTTWLHCLCVALTSVALIYGLLCLGNGPCVALDQSHLSDDVGKIDAKAYQSPHRGKHKPQHKPNADTD